MEDFSQFRVNNLFLIDQFCTSKDNKILWNLAECYSSFSKQEQTWMIVKRKQVLVDNHINNEIKNDNNIDIMIINVNIIADKDNEIDKTMTATVK